MQPYVIKQGDHLASLAHRYGFDADTVWNDESNADLQKLRTDPAILFPGDVLHIPDQMPRRPVWRSLQAGTTNSFSSDAPRIPVAIQFVFDDGSPRSSVACSIDELPDQADLQTDGSGVLTLKVPVNQDVLHVTLADTGDQYVLRLGEMDPVDTVSGMFKRLQNLGYIDPDDGYDETKLDVLRAALCLFRSQQTTVADEQPVPDDDPADPSDDDAPDLPSCCCAYDPDDIATGDDSGTSTAGDGGMGGVCGAECSGLDDDGVLDKTIAALLVKAHGS
jgi:LysM domain